MFDLVEITEEVDAFEEPVVDEASYEYFKKLNWKMSTFFHATEIQNRGNILSDRDWSLQLTDRTLAGAKRGPAREAELFDAAASTLSRPLLQVFAYTGSTSAVSAGVKRKQPKCN